MRRLIHITIATMFLVVGPSLVAAEPKTAANVAALVQQAQVKGLANHPYWMALMHYRRSTANSGNEVVSEIISPGFFLSPRGSKDPSEELVATLTALFDDPGKEPDNHAQCRFVARYQWLRKSLDWGSLTPPPVACQKFREWSQNGQIESLSLVFATGYFGNPASFYGHLLLKFNTSRSTIASTLLDQTMNYGAIVPENEIGLVYVFKGLFGGYDAGFSNQRFYFHNHMYGENELRDMWEYELALSKDQVDQIIAHGWELLGNKFVYYFLNKNCAFQMSELLELVIDQPILPNVPWSIPATVFERLESSRNKDGMPIVRAVHLIPSRQNRFYTKHLALNSTQQRLTQNLVSSGLNFGDTEFREAPTTDKIAVIETLFDYYEFLGITDKKGNESGQLRQKLLMERVGLPAQGASDSKDPPEITPPHMGPLPGMIRLGLLHNSRLGNGAELRIRPAYYDFLAIDAGRLPNSSLTMFDFRAVYADDRLRFRSLDFVSVETLNLSKTSLPGDGGFAWKVKFGLENQDLGCTDCVIGNLVGGLGKAMSVAGRGAVYGMVDLHAQTKHQDSGTLGATARLGLLASPTVAWKSQLMVGRRTYLNGPQSSTNLVRWENRFGRDRNWDVRINFENNVAREYQAAISLYW